jgi:hypothetical protein
MGFHDAYHVKSGDNLTRIARAHLFDNPGPIVAYPPNASFFRNRSVHLIRPGETVLVPYHPDLLKKIIATSRHLIGEVSGFATQLIREQQADRKKLDEFLLKVDAVNFLASLGVGIGSLGVQGAKGAEMTSKQALLWLAESRAAVAGGVATMAIPAPDAPKRDFKFWVRHTLGPWNPSFWASVIVAIKEKDVDIYLYGADATAYKAALKIKQQAEADIARLGQRVAEARRQLAMPFYRHRM